MLILNGRISVDMFARGFEMTGVQAVKVTSEEGVELRSVVCEPLQVLTLSDNPAFFSTLRMDRLQLFVAMFQLAFAPESYREEMSAPVSPSSARETLVRCGYNDQATYVEASRKTQPSGALDCEFWRSFAKAFAAAQLSEQLRRPCSLDMAHMVNKESDKTRCTDCTRRVLANLSSLAPVLAHRQPQDPHTPPFVALEL